MAKMRDSKGQDMIKAKKALLRKVTFMKLLEFIKTMSILAIALKYTGLLEKIIILIST